MSAQLLRAAPVEGQERRSPVRDSARPFLSTLAAGARDRRLALWVVLASGLAFLAMAPFAKTLLPALPPFLPLYQSALVLIDLLTAVLLFGQFAILGSGALLVLAGAYLFSAGMAIAHALSFPGLFAPAGLFGAGGQTTAWLYFFWHGGFPLAVMAYAVLPDRALQARRDGPHALIAVAVLCVVALVAGLYAFVASGNDALPVLMHGNRDAPAKVAVATSCWMLSLVAIVVLWRKRRPLAVLDLWLMVVLWVWVFDIALAAVLNAGRYDVGWYGGRVYGLLASAFVLTVLLFEYTKLYAQVVAARQAERRLSSATLAEKNERLRILHEIDRAIVAGAKPEAIAAAVLPPLRELLAMPRVNLNLIDREAGEGEWLAAAGRMRTHVGQGVRFPLHMLGDLEALARGEAQTIDTAALPATAEREALLASGVRHYMAVPMLAGGELLGALSFGGENASFPADKVTIASETATQLGIAIHQARLRERLARKAERLRIVHEIDRAIISEAKPAAIASAVLQPLRELLGASRVVVNLFDLEAGQVEWLAAAGRRQIRSGGVRYPLSFMGEVEALKRGETQIVDTGRLPGGAERDALLASGVRHYMVVPMIAGGELIGGVSFGGETAVFAPDQVTIAREVADQLAIALSQARLFERVERHAAELEERVRERTAELQAAGRELQDLYDNSPCGYHSVDAEGRFVRMNATWLAWLGYRREEVVGKLRHADIMTPESAELFRTKWFPLFLEQGWLKETEFEYVRKDGSVFPALISSSSMHDEQGRFVMSRSTVTDITEHKRIHAELHELNGKLQMANKELESFSYSVSHDLRAPLRAVDGYALMLEEDYGAKLDDEGRRLLGVVREGAAQMGRLIDDLLNFSQVGRKPIARDSINMDGLVREVVAEATRHGTRARVEVGEVPPIVGDRALIKQVWTNLVSNALKYSGKAESPVVRIGARREGPRQVYWVRDNGAGFDMRYYDKLFGVFQRLHRTDEFEGTGVGLAIVQRVITRHGGRVWAEGEVGAGACFFFALPVEAAK